MKWYERTGVVLGGIIVLGVVFSLLFGVVNGTIFKTQFSDYADDAEAYNHSALNMVERGTLAYEDGEYYRFVRRSTGYPLFLAGVYSVWQSPIAAFVAHEILFVVAIALVWLLARRFLDEYWALLPAFLFAIAWFTGTFVIRIGSDLLGMTLALAFLWAVLRLLEREHSHWLWWSVCAAIAVAVATFVRPVMLYVIPITIIFLLYARWRAALAFTAVAAMIITPALVWNYSTFGTFQLASSGYMLAWRTAELEASPARTAAFTIAAFAGDLAADQFLPGYADDPDPYTYVKDIFEKRVELKKAGIPDNEIEAMFYEEGLRRVRTYPVLFLASGAVNAVRLHTPPNLNGVSMFHFLAGSRGLSPAVGIVLNILVRLIWFGLLAVALWGAYAYAKVAHGRRVTLLFLALFVGYTISTHALFTNAEFRYLLPIVPIYIIFGSYAVMRILEKWRMPYAI